jgi:regulatory protein
MMESIWIKEIIPYGKTKYKIICESHSPFVLYKGELFRYGIKEQTELSGENFEEICKILLKRGKLRAMHLLEKMDYTEFQIRQKLKENAYPQEIIEGVVEFLLEHRYLDDDRYLENYLNYHGNRLSKMQLKQKLRQKGISAEKIDLALENMEGTDESALIRELMRKRKYDPSEADEKVKQKMIRYLLGRGFSYDEIRKNM